MSLFKPLVFEKTLALPVSPVRGFDYLCHPDAFVRLNPPWEKVRIVRKTGGVEDGAELDMRVELAPLLWVRWLARHEGYIPGVQFQDRQITGPFAYWLHTHRVDPIGPDCCELVDHIEYRLPVHGLTALPGKPFVEAKLNRMFAYRHALMKLDLSLPPAEGRTNCVALSQTLACRPQLAALLALTGFTVCELSTTPSASAQVAVAIPGNESPPAFSDSTMVLHGSPPSLPEAFNTLLVTSDNQRALGSGFKNQSEVYAYWWWIKQVLA